MAMSKHFVCSLTAAGLVLLFSACALGYDDTSAAADEWTGRGPHGLMLAHESEVVGKFEQRLQPVPTEFAFLPGIDMRFQLTGAAVPGAAPLYGLLSVSRAWPAELGPPGKT